MTELNKKILEIIQSTEGHLNAEEIYLLCKEKDIKVSIASVYRILRNLVNEGYIRKMSDFGSQDVYDKSTKDHEHLICEGCGKVVDFRLDGFRKLLKEQTGEDVLSYDLTVHFLCKDCKENRKD